MDRTGRVHVLLTPREAQILAENLPKKQLEKESHDIESLEKRLLNGVGGGDAPRSLAGIEQGFEPEGDNQRTGVWGDSESATPSQYEHGYARGME